MAEGLYLRFVGGGGWDGRRGRGRGNGGIGVDIGECGMWGGG